MANQNPCEFDLYASLCADSCEELVERGLCLRVRNNKYMHSFAVPCRFEKFVTEVVSFSCIMKTSYLIHFVCHFIANESQLLVYMEPG